MIKRIPLLIVALMMSGFVSAQRSPAGPACHNSAEQNRQIVTDFYSLALAQKQVRAGFEQYVRPDFVEHKPDILEGNREGAINFLEGMVKELPGAQWRVRRALAEGDVVAVHASFTPTPAAPDYAIADFFRLENCQIVEHWDVVAPPTTAQGNPNSRF
ncbi:MAG: nuclear transport factor 2 family protein [Sphingomicrobium sp.]